MIWCFMGKNMTKILQIKKKSQTKYLFLFVLFFLQEKK